MRVLLVDDQIWLRAALRLLLEQEGNIEVIGEAAKLDALPNMVSQLRPDLLFLDWQLPGLETERARHACVERMRAIVPHLYIIALTNDIITVTTDFIAQTTDDYMNSDLLNDARGNIAGVNAGYPTADAIVSKAEPPERLLRILRHAARHEAGES